MITQHSYIYSASRVNAIASALPRKSHYERLMSTTNEAEVLGVLRETCIGDSIDAHSPEESKYAVELFLYDTKVLLSHILPHNLLNEYLWLQYDIHNLRLFAKAKKTSLSWDDIYPQTSNRGVYDAMYLYEMSEQSQLYRLQIGWQEAFGQMVSLCQQNDIAAADAIADKLVIEAMRNNTAKINDADIRLYTERFIDAYNIKNRLRDIKNFGTQHPTVHQSGGWLQPTAMETKEAIFAALQQWGGDGWRDAIDYLEATDNFTRLDARIDEYLLHIVRQTSYKTFTPASLLFHYLLVEQAAKNIRIITAAKKTGMSNTELRANLRMVYVNE
jgi:vacuolar-type H+-ATPase subunit C/Vma6